MGRILRLGGSWRRQCESVFRSEPSFSERGLSVTTRHKSDVLDCALAVTLFPSRALRDLLAPSSSSFELVLFALAPAASSAASLRACLSTTETITMWSWMPTRLSRGPAWPKNVSGERRLSSACAEAAVAHILRPSSALALLPVRGWVLDPAFLVGLLPALTAVGFDPSTKVWHEPLREAAGLVGDARLCVGPDDVLATRGFDLYQTVNSDLRLQQLEPFFNDLLTSVESHDVAAATALPPAPSLNTGMNLRSSGAIAPSGATPPVIPVTLPPL